MEKARVKYGTWTKLAQGFLLLICYICFFAALTPTLILGFLWGFVTYGWQAGRGLTLVLEKKLGELHKTITGIEPHE